MTENTAKKSEKLKLYIKNQIVFSTKTIKIHKTKEISSDLKDRIKKIHSQEIKEPYLINKLVLEIIDKVIEEKEHISTIEVSKPIEDFQRIKKQILSDKKNIKEPNIDDYEYIEKTSSVEILKQIKKSLEENKDEEFYLNVRKYLEKIKISEKEIISKIEEKISMNKEIIKKIKEERNLLEKIIEKNETQQDKRLKEIEYLIKIKKELNYDEELNDKIRELNQKKKKLDEKIESLEFKSEKYKIQIKKYKAKIQTMMAEMKLGKRKCPNWLVVLLTLGLVFFTKFVECKYQILNLKTKINKLKEKQISLEEKTHKLKKESMEISKEEEEIKLESLEINKKNEIKKKKIEKEIAEMNKEFEKIEKKIEDDKKSVGQLEKEIIKEENKLREFVVLKNEYNKFSSIKIEDKIEMLKAKEKKEIEFISEIIEKLEKQKVDLKKEGILII